MRIYVYDWFNPTSETERWRGRGNAPASVPAWIRAIPTDAMTRFGTLGCNEWSPEDYIGGIKTQGESCCIFRIFDGGRDRKGRPNRWVMLLAEAEKSEICATDIFDALECAVFCDYAHAGIPAQAGVPELMPRWSLHESVVNPALPPPTKKSIVGAEAMSSARQTSLALTSPCDCDGTVWVKKIGAETRAWIDARRVHVSIFENPPRVWDAEPCGTEETSPVAPKKSKFFGNRLFVRSVVLRGLVLLGLLGAACFVVNYFAKLRGSDPSRSISSQLESRTRYAQCPNNNKWIEVLNCPRQMDEKQEFRNCGLCGETHPFRWREQLPQGVPYPGREDYNNLQPGTSFVARAKEKAKEIKEAGMQKGREVAEVVSHIVENNNGKTEDETR